MTGIQEKIAEPDLGLLELAKQLGGVSGDCAKDWLFAGQQNPENERQAMRASLPS